MTGVEDGVDRPVRIAVIGGSSASAEELEVAYRVGEAIARSGAVLVCGGLGGVMEAAARGCHAGGGVSIGLLPGTDPWEANAFVTLPLATGLGEARNALVVRAGEAVISVGGSWGTLSEIAFAKRFGRPIVRAGPVAAGSPIAGLDLPAVADAEEAVNRALVRCRVEAPGPARGEEDE